MAMNRFPHKENVEVIRLLTRWGMEIVAVYIRNLMGVWTLLDSHRNTTDLGQMYELFIELSIHLCINLVGYDYSSLWSIIKKANITDQVS